jgi:regulator of sigma E protease
MTSNNPVAPTEAAPPEPDEAPASGLKQLAIMALGAVIFAVLRPDLFKTVAIFIVVLGVLIFVHEWGHFQFARWAGLKVNRFALGFPPFIYTRRYKGINYSLGALPIGGMVDIAGLGSEEEMVAEVKGQSGAPVVRNTHRPRGEKQFQDVSLGWRFMTLFAGPMMNFLLAIALFIGVYSIAGFPEPVQKARVDMVTAGQPAEKAGLKEGDEIIGVGGKKADELGTVAQAIRGGKATPTTLTILREGKTLTVPITPVVRDIEDNGKPVPSIGIAFDQEAIRKPIHYVKLTPVQAVEQGVLDSATISLGILDTVKRAATGKLAAQEKKAIGGPVKIAKVMNTAADLGLPILLRVAAMLSVNLGLLNLLPFPALDGGRILFLGYELIMRRPVDPRKEGLIHMAGMLMLLSFMLFITLRDVNFFKLFGH